MKECDRLNKFVEVNFLLLYSRVFNVLTSKATENFVDATDWKPELFSRL